MLYLLAPTGPLREGDTVFSNGEQQVRISKLADATIGQTDETCVLDPDSPLLIVHLSEAEANDSFIAQVQGNPSNDWPFCPVLVEVVVRPSQVFQKPAVFSGVQRLLIRFFGSSPREHYALSRAANCFLNFATFGLTTTWQ